MGFDFMFSEDWFDLLYIFQFFSHFTYFSRRYFAALITKVLADV